jgi:hypothetical protein
MIRRRDFIKITTLAGIGPALPNEIISTAEALAALNFDLAVARIKLPICNPLC